METRKNLGAKVALFLAMILTALKFYYIFVKEVFSKEYWEYIKGLDSELYGYNAQLYNYVNLALGVVTIAFYIMWIIYGFKNKTKFKVPIFITVVYLMANMAPYFILLDEVNINRVIIFNVFRIIFWALLLILPYEEKDYRNVLVLVASFYNMFLLVISVWAKICYLKRIFTWNDIYGYRVEYIKSTIFSMVSDILYIIVVGFLIIYVTYPKFFIEEKADVKYNSTRNLENCEEIYESKEDSTC